jgi:hypothetical protein
MLYHFVAHSNRFVTGWLKIRIPVPESGRILSVLGCFLVGLSSDYLQPPKYSPLSHAGFELLRNITESILQTIPLSNLNLSPNPRNPKIEI